MRTFYKLPTTSITDLAFVVVSTVDFSVHFDYSMLSADTRGRNVNRSSVGRAPSVSVPGRRGGEIVDTVLQLTLAHRTASSRCGVPDARRLLWR